MLWHKLLPYIYPQKNVSSLKAIGRASSFFVITSLLMSLVAIVIKDGMTPFVNNAIDIFQLIGFFVLAVAGAFLSLKSFENTRSTNVKFYAATCFAPNILMSASFSSTIVETIAIIGVPLISIVGGHLFLKKYPKMLNN